MAGRVFGSPLYMSPEQAEGKQLGPQSDIYSFACALFEVICSEPPFQGDNVFDTMQMHVLAPIPAMDQHCRVRLPQHLVALTGRMLAKAEETRPHSFDEVVTALKAIRKSLKEDVLIERRARSGKSSGTTTSTSTTQTKGTVKNWLIFTGMAVVLLAAAGGMTFFLTTNNARPIGRKSAQFDDTAVKLFHVDPRTVTPDQSIVAFDRNEDKRTPPKNVRRYFRAEKNGRRYFEFPVATFMLGYFTIASPNTSPGRPTQAIGPVDFESRALLNFHPSNDVSTFPQLLDGFVGGDIEGLTFDPSIECSIDNIKHIKQLSGLRHLAIRGMEVDDKALPILCQLTQLRSLHLRNTHISAPALAKLPYLQKINTLLITGIADASPFIKALLVVPSGKLTTTGEPLNTNLGCLGLSNCDLTDGDIEQIAKFPCISQLDISNNPKLTGASVESLIKMPNLAVLDISLTPIDYKYATVICKIPRLRRVVVDNKVWSYGAKESLKRMKRGLEVTPYR